jgi:hypothetical protein
MNYAYHEHGIYVTPGSNGTIDWRPNEIIKSIPGKSFDCFNENANFECLASALESPFQIIRIKLNKDFSHHILRHPSVLRNAALKIGLLSDAQAVVKLHGLLHKPTKHLEESISNIQAKLGSDYVAMHVRMGGRVGGMPDPDRQNESDLRNAFDCVISVFERYQNSTRSIFFSGDHDLQDLSFFKTKYARMLSSMGLNVITTSIEGKVVHLDKIRIGPRNRNDLKRLVLDFELLRRAAVLVVAPSGFSYVAAKLSLAPGSLTLDSACNYAWGNRRVRVGGMGF